MVGTERGRLALRTWLVALALGVIEPGCDGGEPDEAASTETAETTAAGDVAAAEPLEPEPLSPAQAEAWQLETFEAEVLPMLSGRCSGCHGPVAAQLGLVLGPAGEVSAAEVLRGLVDREAVAAPLPLVAPGDPEGSWLRIKIVGDFAGVTCNGGCGGPMPPAGEPVSDAELRALTEWITATEPSP